jgi:hypothetical protein
MKRVLVALASLYIGAALLIALKLTSTSAAPPPPTPVTVHTRQTKG